MTSDSKCMPCIVKALGEQVGMTPIDWWEYADYITIVFEQGPKLTFQRAIEAEPEPTEPPKPKRKSRKK